MFKIMSISAGWLMGEISDGQHTHFFDYSYLTDFMDDFMLALLTVHGDWPEDEGKNRFKAELEPAIDRWTVSKEQDELHINIKTYGDVLSKSVDEEINLTCDYYDFLNDFIKEMDRVLSCYGLIGYRENWTYEFPLSLYLKLKNICKSKNHMEYKTLSADDNCGTEVLVSNYSREIELLRY